jgi:hypothetical protein
MSLRVDGGASGMADPGWSAANDSATTANLGTQLQNACAADPAQQQADLATIQQRNELLANAYAEADRTGDDSLRQQADALAKLYHDQGMSALANDVYHHTATACSTPPVGWTRASEDPAILAQYGLTQADLAPEGSKFRAELYIPDPAVLGADARPVLSYKGTDVTSPVDWANNFTQGVGQPTDFYNRAMDLAMEVNKATDGQFEITGHSLGGGMATAASAVTGADATTFNSSGLHDSTAREYLAQHNREPIDVADRITAYHVDGDVLTGIQQAASGISPHHADQLASVIRGAIGVADSKLGESVLGRLGVDVPDLSGLKHATGADLRSMPTATGESILLPAVNADGSARPAIVPLGGDNGIIARAEHVVGIAENYIGPLVAIGQAPGNAVSGTGHLADRALDAGGNAISGALDAGSGLLDRAFDAGGGLIDRSLDAGGNLVDGALDLGGRASERALDLGGDLVDGALDLGGRAGERVLDVSGNVVNGALDLGGRVSANVIDGAGQTLGGALSGLGGILPGPLGRAAERSGEAISNGASQLAEFTASATDRVGNLVDGALDNVGAALSRGLDRVGDIAGNVLDNAGRLTGNVLDRAGDIAGNALDRAGLFASGALDRIGDVGVQVAERVGSTVSNALDRGGDALSWLGDRIGGGLRAIGVAGVMTSPVGVAVTATGLTHAGITAANDPVLREAADTLAEMAVRHGGDTVDNGIASVVNEQEAALVERLGG